MLADLVAPAVLFAGMLLLMGYITVSSRRMRIARQHKMVLQQDLQPLAADYTNDRVEAITINGGKQGTRGFVVTILPDRILFYPLETSEPLITVPLASLRWFGRPKKYSTVNSNALWLHTEIDGRWVLVKFSLTVDGMQKIVRTLKECATDEQVLAYRRRRPYIHVGPKQASPAHQDLQGAWTVDSPMHLYLTPEFLVLLDGERVQHVFPLAQVQKIAAVQRLDQPRSGLLRFEFCGEPYAFAMRDYKSFAVKMAEAAKRTLEDPVQWQRKKKKSDAWAGEPVDE